MWIIGITFALLFHKDPFMTSPEELNEFYVEMGNRIRQARLKSKIGQDELAEKLALTRASIVNIEKGRQRPMIHTLLTISVLLKTELYDLIPGSPQPEAPLPAKDFSSWSDFTDVISDEFTLDERTRNTVKQFVKHLKK
ncbi:MAG TPA: helix-turn-helix transcriptional regulator [Cyclobacteriaceae bacterium]|nr:helix-turn-helix transcriptional regulator [Cyclobacteriaceae bacterium]